MVYALRTVPIRSRRHLVSLASFGSPYGELISSLPNLLAAKGLKALLKAMRLARDGGKPIVWACGAHVIKAGVSPYLIALMREKFVTHLALNGAGAIHDFEIGYIGETSEDVKESIADGSFGMATETSTILGQLMTSRYSIKNGIGSSIGNYKFVFGEYSLLRCAKQLGVSASVHVALGTDVIHPHPECNWANLAKAARIDHNKFIDSVTRLNDGGVYLNVGSAVLLPEVFLKAVSVVRNSGLPLDNFTTAVLDMNDHYRPNENVLRRPGGAGIKLIGHHEIMIPLITAALLDF